MNKLILILALILGASPAIAQTQRITNPAIKYTSVPLPAFAVDVTEPRTQTKTVSTDPTFTFTGTPITGFTFELAVTNSSTTTDLTVTIPSCVDEANSATRTTYTLPHNAGGTYTNKVQFTYDGTVYRARGFPTIAGIDYAPPASQTGTLATPSTTTPLTVTLSPSEARFIHIGATGTVNLPSAATCKNAMIYGNFMGSYVATFEPTGSEILYILDVAQTAGINCTATGTISQTVILLSDGTSWWFAPASTATIAAGV